MSLAPPDKTRRIIFVSRNLSGEGLGAARAIKALENVNLFGVCEQLPADEGGQVFADLFQVADAHDSDQLVAAGRALADKHGPLDRIVTTTETLLEPVACAGAVLGLPGMSVATVRRALDKSSLKSILAAAGIDTARDRVLTSRDEATRFVNEVGLPIVLKPLSGSGGLATWCISSDQQLELALDLMKPDSGNAVLAEDYVQGQELCIDTITIASEPCFYSICCYRPSILEALEDDGVQWFCLMPQDIGGDLYHDFIAQGLAAVRALAPGNAMTHMEGFLLKKGGLCFTDATLRPAGARISPMLGFAYDMDPHRAWARVAVDGCFDGPWERKYAVGSVFLRGAGSGVVTQVDGIEIMKRETGAMLVDGRLPWVGAAKSVTYTGDGYVTVRHPETPVVEAALDFIAETVCISYSHPASPTLPNECMKEQWRHRLHYFDQQLNKPAWENDALEAIVKQDRLPGSIR